MKNLEIPFANTKIQAVEHNNELYVSMRPICKNIGLQWGAQYNRIMRDDIMREGVFIMKTASSGGYQDTVMLPLSLLNGWLFGVATNKVRAELREKLVQYKRDCYKALFNYWMEEKQNIPTMEEINRMLFTYGKEKELASFCGKGLVRWKKTKQVLEPTIDRLIEQSQMRLIS